MLGHGADGSVLIWSAVHLSRGHAEQVALVWPLNNKPVVMIEADIPVPAARWEFRTSGLWVEQVCESPHEHWSYGLEAFALELDDPDELIRTGYGTRVPLGWELDFEATAASRWLLSSAQPLERAGAYTQTGTLSGLLLDGDGEHPYDADAQRWHWWGTDPLTSAGIRTGGSLGDERPRRVELPLTQGPLVVEQTPISLLIRSVAQLR